MKSCEIKQLDDSRALSFLAGMPWIASSARPTESTCIYDSMEHIIYSYIFFEGRSRMHKVC